jgi:hypothetical protein
MAFSVSLRHAVRLWGASAVAARPTPSAVFAYPSANSNRPTKYSGYQVLPVLILSAPAASSASSYEWAVFHAGESGSVGGSPDINERRLSRSGTRSESIGTVKRTVARSLASV